jgi:hypothetical protein
MKLTFSHFNLYVSEYRDEAKQNYEDSIQSIFNVHDADDLIDMFLNF